MSFINNRDALKGVLGKGTRFEGKLLFEGHLRVEGQFLGEIFTRDQITLTETAQVKADIKANIVNIFGVFQGNIEADEKIVVGSEAIVKGKITAPNIEIEKGGVVDGQTQVRV